jgi:hypothetical protein
MHPLDKIASLITSQVYISDEIKASKLAACDFAVSVSPVFTVLGRDYRVLLDGHHSLCAAIEAGAEADIYELTATEHDAIALLDAGDIEGFLAAVHMGSDYRDAITGADAF